MAAVPSHRIVHFAEDILSPLSRHPAPGPFLHLLRANRAFSSTSYRKTHSDNLLRIKPDSTTAILTICPLFDKESLLWLRLAPVASCNNLLELQSRLTRHLRFYFCIDLVTRSLVFITIEATSPENLAAFRMSTIINPPTTDGSALISKK